MKSKAKKPKLSAQDVRRLVNAIDGNLKDYSSITSRTRRGLIRLAIRETIQG
jgi:hypothetical protein